MSKSTAVEKTAPSSVPALRHAPALEIDRDDVALPRLYVGSGTSRHVQNGDAGIGQLYSAAGADDPNPEVLYDPKQGGDGVLVHVLSMTKGKSLNVDGQLETWAFNDPDAHPEAWTTYNYTLCLPEVDDQVPFKLTLTRSGAPTAKQINTVLARNAAKGPAWASAFRLTSVKKQNDKGQWFVIKATIVEADDANVATAEGLASMVAGTTADVQATGDQPQI